jgi:nucleotide-binding universal stress UspA family protein
LTLIIRGNDTGHASAARLYLILRELKGKFMKTILVPTDFSKNAVTALRYAIRLSNIMSANIRVLHCYQYSSYQHLITESEKQRELLIKKDGEEQLKKMNAQVREVYHSLKMEIAASTKVQAEFNPFVVEESIRIAQKIKAALIVMGTHGASGLNKYLFGSNTSNMIAKSTIPVLAIPENYRYRPIKTLLFAADFKNFNAELKKVITFAREMSAGIEVLHFDYGGTWEIKRKEIENTAQKSGFNNIKITIQKADATITLLKQIRAYTAVRKPQCLVMFTKERGFWDKLLLGSKTEDMASALPVPLLSFKKTG